MSHSFLLSNFRKVVVTFFAYNLLLLFAFVKSFENNFDY
jgi:hypothetical protein